ncbi:MAG TPA: hypothetical protein VMO81_10260 [Aestuariivirgaceae bacterium]|nr:hypothetical protein [Aestuariivirgaceae bacterium]
MTRTAEAMLIAGFAALVAAPVLAAFGWLVIGPQASGNHVSIVLVLTLAAMVSTFVAARLLLARSVVETWSDGLKLGLWSAVGFYLGWLFVFALVPALVGAPDGLSGFVGFFLRASGHVLWISGGLPLIVGIAGGLMYIALKRRLMPAGNVP